ncbi:MAG: hypothetical protein R6V49_07395 [Bacteroidales bacterium]
MGSGGKISLWPLLLLMVLQMTALPASARAGEEPFDRTHWEKIRKGVDYTEAPPKSAPLKKAGMPEIPPISKIQMILKVIIIVIVAGILLFLTIRLVLMERSGIRVRRQKGYHDETEPEFRLPVGTLKAQLSEAMRQGDFRMAIRIFYLLQLNILEGERLIHLSGDKTNHQYIRELRGTAWHDPFSMLTRWYEAIWFGEAPISGDILRHLMTPWQTLKGNDKS